MWAHSVAIGRKYFNEELENEIACRLSSPEFALTTVAWIPLYRDYEMREYYKMAGATYNGREAQWSIPLGRDFRRLLQLYPAWFEEPDMVRRSILLRMIEDLAKQPHLY